MSKSTRRQYGAYVALILGALVLQSHAKDESGDRLLLEVDYLFWKAQQSQMSYAMKVQGGPILPQQVFLGSEYDIIEPCFKGESGVRVTAGYEFCDCGDTRIAWTHLNGSTSGSVAQNRGIIATDIFIGANDLSASTAADRWDFHFNTLDWELGAWWEPCDDVGIRPHLGIKFAKIDQVHLVAYTGLLVTENVFNGSAVVSECNNFYGVGPRMGLDMQWGFCDNFALFAGVSGALVYGKFDTHDDVLNEPVHSQISIVPANQTIIDISKRLVAEAQASVGFNWQACSRECADITIGIAYEAQYWWGQWRAMPSLVGAIASSPASGDFTTHGLTLQLGIEF